MTTYIIGGIVFIAFVAVIVYMVIRRKNGGSACGCDCSECLGCSDNKK